MIYILNPIAVLIIILISVCCVVRRKLCCAIVLFILALCFNWWSESIAMHPFGNNNTVLGEKRDLRILTYNVWNVSPYLNEHREEGILEIVGSIMEIDADIVVLNELSYRYFNQMIDSLKLRYPCNTKTLFRDSYMETHVFSRFPISDFQNIRYEDGSPVNNMTWLVTMTLNMPETKPIRLYACHLAANQISNLLPDETISLWHKAKMVYSSMSSAYDKRSVQAEMIRNGLDSCDIPKLVVGDFNDVGGSYTLRHILGKDMADAWWKAGFGYGATYDMHNLYLRLDHILYSENDFNATNTKVLSNWKYSDHYPIVADLKLCIK